MQNHSIWKSCLGKLGTGKVNTNRECFLNPNISLQWPTLAMNTNPLTWILGCALGHNTGIWLIAYHRTIDPVNRTTVWNILRKWGCPNQFIHLISFLHFGMKASVCLRSNSRNSRFGVTNEVEQECALITTLLSIFLTMVLNHAFAECKQGVWIHTKPGADLFKSTIRTRKELIRELTFSDDNVLVSHHHHEAQDIRCANSAKVFMLKITTTKTAMIYQSGT